MQLPRARGRVSGEGEEEETGAAAAGRLPRARSGAGEARQEAALRVLPGQGGEGSGGPGRPLWGPACRGARGCCYLLPSHEEVELFAYGAAGLPGRPGLGDLEAGREGRRTPQHPLVAPRWGQPTAESIRWSPTSRECPERLPELYHIPRQRRPELPYVLWRGGLWHTLPTPLAKPHPSQALAPTLPGISQARVGGPPFPFGKTGRCSEWAAAQGPPRTAKPPLLPRPAQERSASPRATPCRAPHSSSVERGGGRRNDHEA